MSEFAIIPVLDLKGGAVVHAKGGKRADYRPIETPLGDARDPLSIARALLAVTESPVLYVADLDAIEGVGNHFDLCRELAVALLDTTLWIDAGFGDLSDCTFWLPLGTTLVIGTESVLSLDDWNDLKLNIGNNLVLSIDIGREGYQGPENIFTTSELWPDRVIAMNLPRVGTEEGPDLDLLNDIVARAGDRAVYAAGGVRNIDDLDIIASSGAQGALLATALHDGSITQNEIAAFLRRRRSQ
ncbi:MAG TPA: HisA/HisF-related TIM barrel protein [Methyloceanibacter sp.]|nr:HisA/HisF-related TIM barrel protein [Methyloceanibacter sp.]